MSEIDRLRALNAELVAALEPFAKMADQVDEWMKGGKEFEGEFEARWLREARAAIAKAKHD